MKTKTMLTMTATFALACGPAWIPATMQARVVATAAGAHVTLPGWFEAQFPCPVHDSTGPLRTPQGDLSGRTFACQLPTGYVAIFSTRSEHGWNAPKQRVLVDLIEAVRTGKQLTDSRLLKNGRFIGADLKVTVAPHAPDNPNAYPLECRERLYIDDSKLLFGMFCYDAAHPDAAFARAADSFVVPG